MSDDFDGDDEFPTDERINDPADLDRIDDGGWLPTVDNNGDPR